MMEFEAMYPGNYPLVDHQIANAIDKGAYAILNVTGWANTTIFHKDISTVDPLDDAPLQGAGALESPVVVQMAATRELAA